MSYKEKSENRGDAMNLNKEQFNVNDEIVGYHQVGIGEKFFRNCLQSLAPNRFMAWDLGAISQRTYLRLMVRGC